MKNKISSNILDLAQKILENEEANRQQICPGFFLIRKGLEISDDVRVDDSELIGKSGDKFIICTNGIF
jgi:hypothetical protein